MTNEELLRKHAARKRRREQFKAIAAVVIMLAIALGFMIYMLNRPKLIDDYPVAESEAASDVTQGDAQEEVLEETEPVAEEPEEEPAAPVYEDTTLLFTGDVELSNYVLSNYNASGINGIISEDMLNEMVSADLTIINNEFPFSTRGQQAPDKKFTFRVDPKYSVILNEMGVDVASLANNHVLDYGRDALSDTFETLDAAGIDYMGAGDSLERASALITKEVNGKVFGFLAASRVIPVTSWDIKNSSPGVFTTYDPALLIEAIKDAQDKCDFLTVFVHWGIERDAYPQDYQVNMAKMYADAGADLVIGAHPHVLQGITYEGDTPVFYSLGNFIFNQSIPMTAAVKVTVPYEGEPVVTLVPGSASDARTYVPEGDAAEKIFSYLESISKNIEITEEGILVKQ